MRNALGILDLGWSHDLCQHKLPIQSICESTSWIALGTTSVISFPANRGKDHHHYQISSSSRRRSNKRDEVSSTLDRAKKKKTELFSLWGKLILEICEIQYPYSGPLYITSPQSESSGHDMSEVPGKNGDSFSLLVQRLKNESQLSLVFLGKTSDWESSVPFLALPAF
jgi:hypothetical protein